MHIINNKILSVLKYFLKRKPAAQKFLRAACGPSVLCNINKRAHKQKRVLLCYLPQCYEPHLRPISHANVLHANAMINGLIDKDCCIDVCYCNDDRSIEILKNRVYDYIIGFGRAFEDLSRLQTTARLILLVTENDPSVVLEKYEERKKYLKIRHPKINPEKFIARTNFYRPESFHIADTAIIMNSDWNINRFKIQFKNTYPINVNGIYNSNFNIYNKLSAEFKANRFIWFGSSGLLHKGLDILVDAFSMCPELKLDVYGANTEELRQLGKLPSNVNIKGRVDVLSDTFIDIANQNTFIISASCSEGMSTAVATCMMHGLIPIISKENGYDEHEGIIFLGDFSVESVKETIMNMSSLNQCQLQNLSRHCYDYSHTSFSLEHFEQSFFNIINDILSD